MQISRYAADHGVAFPDLLTRISRLMSAVTTHEIVPLFFKKISVRSNLMSYLHKRYNIKYPQSAKTFC